MKAIIPLKNIDQTTIVTIAKVFNESPPLFTDTVANNVNWTKHRGRGVGLLRLVSSALANPNDCERATLKRYIDGTHYFLGKTHDNGNAIAITICPSEESFDDYLAYSGTFAGLTTWLNTLGLTEDNITMPGHEIDSTQPKWANPFETLDETAMRLASEGDTSAVQEMVSAYMALCDKRRPVTSPPYQRIWDRMCEKHPTLAKTYKEKLRERDQSVNSLTKISTIVKEVSRTLAE